jgi:predicted nuclease of predicted toxin-antitoxin system
MKFLTDQDVFAVTFRLLRDLGHDVATTSERGLGRAEDSELLKTARSESRIFVTRDRDFGHLAFVKELGAGIIYLRLLPTNLRSVHEELKRVLSLYGENDLLQLFVVVEPGRHRIRRAK